MKTLVVIVILVLLMALAYMLEHSSMEVRAIIGALIALLLKLLK